MTLRCTFIITRSDHVKLATISGFDIEEKCWVVQDGFALLGNPGSTQVVLFASPLFAVALASLGSQLSKQSESLLTGWSLTCLRAATPPSTEGGMKLRLWRGIAGHSGMQLATPISPKLFAVHQLSVRRNIHSPNMMPSHNSTS